MAIGKNKAKAADGVPGSTISVLPVRFPKIWVRGRYAATFASKLFVINKKLVAAKVAAAVLVALLQNQPLALGLLALGSAKAEAENSDARQWHRGTLIL